MCMKFPWIRNCVVELLRTTLEELILAAMVNINKVELPLWLQQFLYNGLGPK